MNTEKMEVTGNLSIEEQKKIYESMLSTLNSNKHICLPFFNSNKSMVLSEIQEQKGSDITIESQFERIVEHIQQSLGDKFLVLFLCHASYVFSNYLGNGLMKDLKEMAEPNNEDLTDKKLN